jgi:hypothetical protein
LGLGLLAQFNRLNSPSPHRWIFGVYLHIHS